MLFAAQQFSLFKTLMLLSWEEVLEQIEGAKGSLKGICVRTAE
jgi:hypothetical protein